MESKQEQEEGGSKTATEESPSTNGIGLSGTKILVVEDDSFLRDLLARKLNQEKCEISYAVDGESALENINNNKPDIILLDILLPGMSGFDVLEKIKKDEALKDIPVIILSNLGQRDDIEKGKQLGAVDFLIKSNFTIGQVIARVKQVINDKGE